MSVIEIDKDLKSTGHPNYRNEDKLDLVGSCGKEAPLTEPTPDTQFYHINYMGYLQRCYNGHHGYVLSPDMIWYTLMCEFAGHIKKNVEEYRAIFSEEMDMQEISVEQCSTEEFMKKIVAGLAGKVPVDIDTFFPEFTTSTEGSTFATMTAFADAVSPYYSYSMYMCGYPCVDVRGTKEDWEKIYVSFATIINTLFNVKSEYVGNVEKIIKTIISSFDADEETPLDFFPDFFRDIFGVERCGSGSQETVTGWFASLYMETPKIGFVHNYSTHISQVTYKNLTTDERFKISTGIFGSDLEQVKYRGYNMCVPKFGRMVHNITEVNNG